ncbi:MAG: class I SAM-dependent methyltransferase [Nocardioidaceae bacterium]
MDPRSLSHRWIPGLVAGMDRFNARHPWVHNDHFHGWVLRHLPERRRRALDVGCGRGGLLLRLAPRFDDVLGTDVDDEMRSVAAGRLARHPHARVSAEQLSDLAGPFDLVTMVASLHHLDTAAALREVSRLLAPGGRLLVVGLVRCETPLDWAWDAACLVSNPVIGLVKHPRAARGAAAGPAVPVQDPEETLAELRALFEDSLPGARLRRRIGFRYTAAWTKPSS